MKELRVKGIMEQWSGRAAEQQSSSLNKKSSLVALLLLIFCASALLHFGSPATAEAQLAVAQLAGQITKVEGRVDILRAGAAAAVPVKMGDAVNVGDILRTKSDGKAELTFIDNTVMTVGPRSRLGIYGYFYKPDEEKRFVSLKIYRGRMGFQIPKPVYPAEGSKFEIKTKTAVADVRGSEGIIHTDGVVERVYVKDGVIEFSNPLGSVIVSAGEVGKIFAGRAPVERPYSEREYQQQARQMAPALPERAAAPPAEVTPPLVAQEQRVAREQRGVDVEKVKMIALLPPPDLPTPYLPTPDLPTPDLPTLTPTTWTASANILDGELLWSAWWGWNIAAVIQSGAISGSFNRTIPEGGSYSLNMSGSYAWVAGRSIIPVPIWWSHTTVTDHSFLFFYSSPADGGPLHIHSARIRGHILRDPANTSLVHPERLWSGRDRDMGWIAAGTKKYWYLGRLSGSYSTIFFNDTSVPLAQSGTFSARAEGLFWDGSVPFWEVYNRVFPTTGPRPQFFSVPITETALRTFDIRFNAGQTLSLWNDGGWDAGIVSVTPGVAGSGREQTPGSGLFDVNIKGNWSVSAGNDITNLRSMSGNITGTTTIDTSFRMGVGGRIRDIDSNTAIVDGHAGNRPPSSFFITTDGVMVGKMTGSTSGTFDAKAVGEISSGFMLPAGL